MSTDSDDWRVEIYPDYYCGSCEWSGTSEDLDHTPYPVCPECGNGVFVAQ